MILAPGLLDVACASHVVERWVGGLAALLRAEDFRAVELAVAELSVAVALDESVRRF